MNLIIFFWLFSFSSISRTARKRIQDIRVNSINALITNAKLFWFTNELIIATKTNKNKKYKYFLIFTLEELNGLFFKKVFKYVTRNNNSINNSLESVGKSGNPKYLKENGIKKFIIIIKYRIITEGVISLTDRKN